jgi:hypothetical protein
MSPKRATCNPDEMKRRISLIIAFAVLGTVILVAGCSGRKASGVFSVKRGMTEQQVRKVAGAPHARTRYGKSFCLRYYATKHGTPIDGMCFCFASGRVSLVQTSMHL